MRVIKPLKRFQLQIHIAHGLNYGLYGTGILMDLSISLSLVGFMINYGHYYCVFSWPSLRKTLQYGMKRLVYAFRFIFSGYCLV